MGGRWLMYSDGACRGNPGPSSIGVVLQDPDGDVAEEIARRIGDQTNNYAECEAVRSGFERALALGADSVLVRTDSELCVRQLTGVYSVENENLRPLFLAIKSLEAEFPDGVEYEQVRRAHNREAETLANQALDGVR